MATGRVPTTANSPLTAKGDLFGYSTTQARVAVGNDGETLVADSSTSTGLRYVPATVVSNPVLNSAFQVWQRGTSFTSGLQTNYTADRWVGYRSGAANTTFTRQVTGDTTNLPNVQYCARVQRDSGNAATQDIYFYQYMETINSIPFAGKTITFSFYARKGANYSPTSSLLVAEVVSGTGTDQNYGGGLTGSSTTVSGNATLTSTWQRFTYTGTVASTATELTTSFRNTPTGTAGAADYYEITGVQIDVGSVALPFRTYAATIQGELAACQRYYTAWNFSDAVSDCAIGQGFASSATSARIYINLPVPMRVAPTVIDWTNTGVNYITGEQGVTALAFTPSVNNRSTAALTATVAGGLTASAPQFLNTRVSNRFGLGAEL
jgi:hypothetical protein